MPLLIYACKRCGEEREFLLGQGESPDDEVCACGASAWRREMPRRVGIRFIGDGFYKNDSRAAAKAAKAGKAPTGSQVGKEGSTAGKDGSAAGKKDS